MQDISLDVVSSIAHKAQFFIKRNGTDLGTQVNTINLLLPGEADQGADNDRAKPALPVCGHDGNAADMTILEHPAGTHSLAVIIDQHLDSLMILAIKINSAVHFLFESKYGMAYVSDHIFMFVKADDGMGRHHVYLFRTREACHRHSAGTAPG